MEETATSSTSVFKTNTGWFYKLKMWFLEYKRVVQVTKKPTKEEYLTVVKVSGLGILIIGLIGFIIQMIEILLFK